jgi:hypothetical protein
MSLITSGPGYSPDKNGSGKAIRNFKTRLGIMGFFKSIQGLYTYPKISHSMFFNIFFQAQRFATTFAVKINKLGACS